MTSFALVEGTSTIHSDARPFVAAFVRRIEAGLLAPAPHPRNHYHVTRQAADGLEFRAEDWRTALNVGLNDVQLAVGPEGRVRYAIRYRRWASYVLAMGAAFAVVFSTFLLLFDIRGYIERNAASRVPGLSTSQNVAIAWAMAVVWGFVFPWILIALHKGPLRSLMDRLITEVDAAAKKEN